MVCEGRWVAGVSDAFGVGRVHQRRDGPESLTVVQAQMRTQNGPCVGFGQPEPVLGGGLFDLPDDVWPGELLRGDDHGVLVAGDRCTQQGAWIALGEDLAGR